MRALTEAQQRNPAEEETIPPVMGVADSSTEEAEEDEGEEEVSPLLQSMDDDLASALDRFNNAPRRKKIEASLPPMSAEDLILKGEIRQEVPISCGIKAVFRTTSGLEHDGMLDELGHIAATTSGSELFLRERLANYNLTLQLYAVGSKTLSTHLTKDSEFDLDGFRKKYTEVMKLPLLVIADLRVQCFWFDERVRGVMVAEELGNG
jgi:hypothetical protein